MLARVAVVSIMTLSVSWMARAQEVADCKDALIMSTMQKASTSTLDYRLASLVTKEEYDKRDQSAGVNVVIYGVPVGANWSDFQENIRKYTSAYSSSLSTSQADNLMWTGLDANSVTTYSQCLNANVFSTIGLHLRVESATSTDITLNVVWNANAALPQRIQPRWQTATGELMNVVPQQIPAGRTRFSVKRPNHQLVLNVGFQGFADGVTLEPLPEPVKAPEYVIEGRWCTDGPPAPSELYLHLSGSHLDYYVSGPADKLVDTGYAGYYFQNRPASEVPLFSNRSYLFTGNRFSITDTYTPSSDQSNKFNWRTTQVTFEFLDKNVIQPVNSLAQDQTGAAYANTVPKLTYKRCPAVSLTNRIIEPGNGLWKSSLPAFQTGTPPANLRPLGR